MVNPKIRSQENFTDSFAFNQKEGDNWFMDLQYAILVFGSGSRLSSTNADTALSY